MVIMSCPYSDEELAIWDGVTNPMSNICYTCTDFDCEHNSNYDENPECIDFDDMAMEMFDEDKEN